MDKQKRLDKLQLEVKALKMEIEEEEEKKASADLTLEQKLAITLHESLCSWNHTDGCGWHYAVRNGVHDWSEWSHGQYLAQAHKLMSFCRKKGIDPELAVEIYSQVEKP